MLADILNQWKLADFLPASQLRRFLFAGFKGFLVNLYFSHISTSQTFLAVYRGFDLSDDHVCFGLEVIAFCTGARCNRWIEMFLLAFQTFYVCVTFLQIFIVCLDP